MTHITEIIPEDMPEWMKEAFDEGQFFARVIERFEIMEADSEEAREQLRVATSASKESFGQKVTLMILWLVLACGGMKFAFSLFEPYLATASEVVQAPVDPSQS